MLIITKSIAIPMTEIEITAIRAQGAGGQNVNKVSNAVHIRFNVNASTLPQACKERLLAMRDTRITQEGDVLIKAQRYRSLEQNREDALARLAELIRKALYVPKTRRATKPSLASRQRRLASKEKHARTKAGRGRVRVDD